MNEEPEFQENAHATAHALVQAVGSGGSHLELRGLLGSAGAYLAASLLPGVRAPLYLLAPDGPTALALYQDLRFFHSRPEEIYHFPAWEPPPYEPLSPHPEVEAARLATLAAMAKGTAGAVVLPVRALLQRVIPREVLDGLCGKLRAGEEVPREALIRGLVAQGYRAAPLVEDRGTFSVRGDLLDIFPPTQPEPVRVEFFGDTVERLRPFDPVTQRSRPRELRELVLLPSREMVLEGEHLETFTRRLKQRGDELGIPRTAREAILEELREGIFAPGREFLLPLNYPTLDSFFAYAGGGVWMVADPPAVEQAADAFAAEVAAGAAHRQNQGELYADPASFFLSPAEALGELSRQRRIDLASLALFRPGEEREVFQFEATGNGDLRPEPGGEGGVGSLARRLGEWRKGGWRALLVCHQQGQAERLLDLLEPHGARLRFDPEGTLASAPPGEPLLVLGELSAGFRLPDEKLAVVTEEEIYGQRTPRRRSGGARARALLSTLAQLREGDFVVHADHGIGHYRGLVHLKTGTVEGDFLHLEYAAGDKLYLPIDRIEKIQKYVGGEGHTPRLDRMGGGAWEKAKLRARAAVEELARDLLKTQALREMRQGHAYSPPDRHFREFEAAFEYEETPDQLSAIQDVLADLQAPRPMDRLVCGDVGYGKTEVAIRAALKVVLDGRQVAVLVPTTVLARQHWETFRERFSGLPVEVEMVSRFRTPAEQKRVLERAAEGKVDILVGTHRLLQRDVRFRNLGLVIVDEEQRFGVSHKERLKKFRAEVDFLTLTATPIPRTLHQSMVGLRDLSVIETPPVDRLAIRTYVTRLDDEVVRGAILSELRRGGQVFFVHNRVESIGAMADYLRRLVPEAKVAVGHGQMGEKALEEVMVDFVEGRSNVLLCTTIIENGLDIPRANTIIVNRADCFGLSQLYQLRGRVGRSRQRAYAYLLIPGEATLTRDARERLRVLQELSELGAGFRIASHDLELRGAGDLLGARQSGQITAVGFEMYTELLEQTMAELKGLEREQKIDPELRLGISAFFPEAYIPDPNQRLVAYQKLAAAEEEESIYETADELRDRYGEIPPPGVLLLEVMKLRVVMKRLKVELAEYDGRQLTFGFHGTTPVPPEKILALLKEDPARHRFTPDYRLTVQVGRLQAPEVLPTARKALQGLL